MDKRIKNVLLLVSASLVCVSCNTLVGAGQDLKRVGEGTENLARGKTWTGLEREANGHHPRKKGAGPYYDPSTGAPPSGVEPR